MPIVTNDPTVPVVVLGCFDFLLAIRVLPDMLDAKHVIRNFGVSSASRALRVSEVPNVPTPALKRNVTHTRGIFLGKGVYVSINEC